MPFTSDACRIALKDVIGGGAGVVPGQVYKYRRVIRTEEDLKTRFGNPINGWQISFASSSPIQVERNSGFHGLGQPGGGRVLTTFRFQIEAYFGLDDASDSEESFENLVESVVARINSYGKIPGLDTSVTMQQPCIVERMGYMNFAQMYLTHYALAVIEFQGQTQP